MTIAVSEIITKVGLLLNDDGSTRWTEAEVIGWINDAVTAIINIRPMAGAATGSLTLVDGVVQTVDCVEILDLIRNDGGSAITRTKRFLLDTADPDWMFGTKGDTVIHYTFDERFRNQCYVYPPVNSGTIVEALLAILPTEVATNTDTVNISNDYMNAIINFVLYRCYGKDDEVGSGQIAQGYLSAFNNLLGLKTTVSLAVSPNKAEP